MEKIDETIRKHNHFQEAEVCQRVCSFFIITARRRIFFLAIFHYGEAIYRKIALFVVPCLKPSDRSYSPIYIYIYNIFLMLSGSAYVYCFVRLIPNISCMDQLVQAYLLYRISWYQDLWNLLLSIFKHFAALLSGFLGSAVVVTTVYKSCKHIVQGHCRLLKTKLEEPLDLARHKRSRVKGYK